MQKNPSPQLPNAELGLLKKSWYFIHFWKIAEIFANPILIHYWDRDREWFIFNLLGNLFGFIAAPSAAIREQKKGKNVCHSWFVISDILLWLHFSGLEVILFSQTISVQENRNERGNRNQWRWLMRVKEWPKICGSGAIKIDGE